MFHVRPSERPKLIDACFKDYLIRDVWTDGRAADIGGLGQQFTKEGPLASDARTLGRYGRSQSIWGEMAGQSDGEAVARPLFLISPSITVGNVRTVRTSCCDPDLMRRDHPVADRER
jgi:hypothetical protein